MLTIPSIPKNYGPWNFKCQGPGPKFIKYTIEEICKFTLVYQKIKKSEVYIDIYLKSEENMAKLNKKFLHKIGPCDTISVPIDNQSLKDPSPTLLGMIFLCLPIIKEDAIYLKRHEIAHLAHIVIHSTLHLLGFTHENEQDSQSMEAKEKLILAKLGIPAPYANFPYSKLDSIEHTDLNNIKIIKP
jgi:probable rRNA maturation factor